MVPRAQAIAWLLVRLWVVCGPNLYTLSDWMSILGSNPFLLPTITADPDRVDRSSFQKPGSPARSPSGAARSPLGIAQTLFGEAGFPLDLAAEKVLDSIQLGVVEKALLYTHQETADKDRVDAEELRKIFAANLGRALDEIYTLTIAPLVKVVEERGAGKVLEDLKQTSPDGHYEHLTGKDERFDLSYLYAFSVLVECSLKIAERLGSDRRLLKKIGADLARLVKELSSASRPVVAGRRSREDE